MHVLEAGHEPPERPLLLLLHGFPELAYSWRSVMPALADAGWHVVAPDQRGYGRTTGWIGRRYDDDIAPFRPLNLVRDALGLVAALGRRRVDAVVGHDFGSPIAAWCALVRPDVFPAVALMSAPFGGPPALPPLGVDAAAPAAGAATRSASAAIAGLAGLSRPRKHYQWYYSTPEADRDMLDAPQGLHAFLRAYYHHKSADWPGNAPHPLPDWSAESLATLPDYYVMDEALDMPATVAPHMPTPERVAACRWLPDDALSVYAAEFARTGFQGGLQWYRCATGGRFLAEHQLFAGRRIDVPSLFVAGAADWGVHQKPGEFEAMQAAACTDLRGVHLLEGAGHWVQQERPEAVAALLVDFVRDARRGPGRSRVRSPAGRAARARR
ncbi:MAG TPA: alpha/beta hydrolase [Burkholderiaceae bacterium]|nr:alpha/beta hydrolase [Burkholderiaceae bacterium]